MCSASKFEISVFIFTELDPEKRSEAVDKSVGDSTVDKINDITDGVAQEMKDSLSKIESPVNCHKACLNLYRIYGDGSQMRSVTLNRTQKTR